MSGCRSVRTSKITISGRSNPTYRQVGWTEKKDKVGYEINFNRYFYQYTPLRSLTEIADELLALEQKNEGLLSEVLGSVADS